MRLFQFIDDQLQRAKAKLAQLLARSRRRNRSVCWVQPRLQILEDRTLLAVWAPIGPSPQHDPNRVSSNNPGEDVTGRVSALAVSSNYDGANHPALFAGAAGGGIWRSTDFTAANLAWQRRSWEVGSSDRADGIIASRELFG